MPAVVLTLVFVLVGCSAPIEEPAPVPATTSEPAALVRPVVRVEATCEQLIPETVDSFFSAPVDHVITEDSPIRSLSDAAIRTTGTLYCSRGVLGDSPYPVEQVTIESIPDGAAGFADQVQYFVHDDYTVFDSVGDASAYYCNSYEADWGCSGEMLVGTIWAHVSIQSSAAGVGDDVARARMEGVLLRAAALLRNGQPTIPAFVAPADAIRGPAICEDDARVFPIVSSAFGMPDPFHYGYDSFFTASWYVGMSGSAECGFASESDDSVPAFSISVLPGGAWWADDWKDTPPALFGTTLEIVTIPGVTGYVGCSGQYCTAVLSGAGSAFEVWSSSMSEDQLIAGLSSFPQLIAV